MALDRQPIEKLAASVLVIRQQLQAMEGELAGLLEGQAAEPERPPAEPQPQPAGPQPQPVEPERQPTEPEPQASEADLAGGLRATGSAGAAARSVAGDDAEGARLIALNMALNGSSREETARYLSENFSLSDREGLLDDVYSSIPS